MAGKDRSKGEAGEPQQLLQEGTLQNPRVEVGIKEAWGSRAVGEDMGVHMGLVEDTDKVDIGTDGTEHSPVVADT